METRPAEARALRCPRRDAALPVGLLGAGSGAGAGPERADLARGQKGLPGAANELAEC